jgi:beta-barrel assembly-enhancing protease
LTDKVEASAQYSDGRTAARRQVSIAIEARQLTIRDDHAAIDAWPIDDVRLVERPTKGGTARLCRHGGAERIAFRDDRFLSALRAASATLERTPYAPLRWHGVAFGLIAMLAVMATAFFILLPRFATLVADNFPPKLEQRMGKWLIKPISDQLRFMLPGKGTEEFCAVDTGQHALQQLVDRLGKGTSLRFPLHVQVLNSSMINAFALPGGQIVVLRGLIDFAETPNELAGVLAHEIAHENLHHPTRLVIERSAGGFLVGLVFGDVVGASALGGLAGAMIGARYSREAEAQADAHGLELLTYAGIDGGAWADLFDRLGRKETHNDGALSLLEGHPPTPERADLIRKASRGGEEALSLADWRALKEICR